jgi:SAM-dependent methyltransferase
MKCRHCGSLLAQEFLDLGHAPPSNAYLTWEALRAPEITYPLRLFVCSACFLVQTEDCADAEELFAADYAYFSSTSRTWLKHAAQYADMITERLGLEQRSLVVEVACNDGYLLRNFVESGIPCLGIEPTHGTAAAARSLGIEVIQEFFCEAVGHRLATEGRRADLICGNNVYAHVPDINDFTRGLAAALKPEGVVTLEFPHLMQLLEHCQFDTVYHEHFSYLSLAIVSRIFKAAGMRVFDVEKLLTHGGSLRVYCCLERGSYSETPAVADCLAEELERRMDQLATYSTFQQQADEVKNGLLAFLLDAKRAGHRVAGYGAAAKGNTLLNYSGVRSDLLSFICDAAPSKQGKFMPGSHIPILPPEVLAERRPDYLLILPWNIAEEVRVQLATLAEGGMRFVTAVPELVVS